MEVVTGVATGFLQAALKAVLKELYTALRNVKNFKEEFTVFKKQLDSLQVLFEEIEKHRLESVSLQDWLHNVKDCLEQSKDLVSSAAEKHNPLSKSKIVKAIQTKGTELEKLVAKGRDVQTCLTVQIAADVKKIEELAAADVKKIDELAANVKKIDELAAADVKKIDELAANVKKLNDGQVQIVADVKKIEEHLVELSVQTQQYMLGGGNKQGIVSTLTTIQSSKRMDHISKDNHPPPVVWQDQQEPTFGREETINNLEELLLNPAGPKIIALHGYGGVGKTHVVQSLINRPTVQSCFGADSVFWISVGNDSTVPDLQQTMEENISKVRTANGLIILDDIWKKEEATFVCQRSQNINFRFIITTRGLKFIEALLPSICPVPLEILPATHSWNLFIYHAFPCFKETDIPTDLKDVAMSVAQECKGLPLALKVIGRAMSDKTTTAEWDDALQKLKEHKMIDGDHEKHLVQVLRLSYDALESMEEYVGKLRECFLYFGAFYEDENISVAEDLMNCWLREGLLLKDKKNPMQQTYIVLGVLIGYSLIERSDRDTCKIHDVLRDLTFQISRKERPNKDLFQPKSQVQLDSMQPTELTYERISWRYCKKLSLVEIKAPHLKVLLLDGSSISQEFLDAALPNLSSLQVLSLSGTKRITRLPDCFDKLQCLLVLNLSYSEIENLPPSLGELKELTILDLSCCDLAKLPTDKISGLQKLQVLKLPHSFGPSFDPGEHPLSEEDLSKYRNLTRLAWFVFKSTTQQLPVYLESMTELTILKMDCPIMDLDRLKSLSKLEDLNIFSSKLESLPDWIADFSKLIKLKIGAKNGKHVPDLDRLVRLRSLSLSGWSLLASMPKLPPCLEYLEMARCECLEVEDGLMHGGLRSLSIYNCKKLSLKCVADLPNLKTLNCQGCDIQNLPEAKAFPQVEEIVILNKEQQTEIPLSWVLPNSLPNLTVLEIRCASLKLPKMIFKGALPKLYRLDLFYVAELPGLGKGAFPNLGEFLCNQLQSSNLVSCNSSGDLENLKIVNSNLESLPDWIADLPNLIELEISTKEGKYIPDLDRLGRLRHLSLKGWSLLALMPKLPPCLEYLRMASCECLEVEDGLIHGHLSELCISDCDKLSLKSVAHLPNLKELEISGGIRSLPEAKAIPQVEWINSQKTEIPLSWLLPNSLCNLRHLSIGCGNAEMIVKGALPKLKILRLFDVAELPGLEEGAFPNLRELDCHFKKGCTKFPDSLWRFLNALPLLDHLTLQGKDVTSFDEWGSSSVPKSLGLEDLKVKRLPSEMGAQGSPFHSLEKLVLWNFEELEELPHTETLKLTLYDCPNWKCSIDTPRQHYTN